MELERGNVKKKGGESGDGEEMETEDLRAKVPPSTDILAKIDKGIEEGRKVNQTLVQKLKKRVSYCGC